MKAKKGEVIHKLKIARGQIDGILQMIEEDRYCVDRWHNDAGGQREKRLFCP